MSEALSDVVTIFDGPHATPERKAEGKYFLNIACLNDGRLDLAAADRVSEDDFRVWTRRVTPVAGDLLFSYETRLGEAALMPEGVDACLGRRMALLRPKPGRVHPRFLLYYFLSPRFQRLIEINTIHGATVNRIGLASMGQWPVEFPKMENQRAIAEVLGALDDKIAANQQVSTVTERLSVALVPTKGELVTVRSVAEHVRKQIEPSLMAARVDHFSLPAFDERKLPQRTDSSTIKSAKFVLDSPAVLVSKLNPRFPRVWDVLPSQKVSAVASTEFVVLEPREISTGLLATLLSQPHLGVRLEGMAAGTSGSHQRVKPAEILSLMVPDPALMTPGLKDQVSRLRTIARKAREESAQLAALRDSLLPALMSGKLRVRDAEKTVEEVL